MVNDVIIPVIVRKRDIKYIGKRIRSEGPSDEK